MAIQRIDGPGDTNPERELPRAKQIAPTSGASFGDVLKGVERTNMQSELAMKSPDQVADSLIAWSMDPVRLALAMSIIMSMEESRRLAIEAALKDRKQDELLGKLSEAKD